MGDRARQRQEVELWQVVSPPERRKNNISDIRRTKPVSNYSTAARNRQMRADRPQAPVNRQMRADRPQAPVNRQMRADRSQAPVNRQMRADRPQAPVNRQMRANRPQNSVNQTRPNLNTVNPARARAMQKRYEARRRQVRMYRILTAVWIVALIAAVAFAGKVIFQNADIDEIESKSIKSVFNEIPIIGDNSDAKKPVITEDFLTISEYNRPGTKLAHVNSIFVHYTANPKTSAAQNRSYFQNLAETHERAASAHFIIGYEGEIIQCIPLDEEAYAVVDRNKDSVSIECCYINEDGSFTQETYDSLVAMLAWLTDKYNLDTKDILRHYDCGGKLCPIYYVENEDAWDKLLSDVENYKL